MNHLRWMGHATTIFEMQRNLREQHHSCEITLMAKGHSVRAHRIVLCSCSDLLRSLLADVPAGQEATLIVPDIKGALLESVISFVYMGETSLTSANLTDFLEAINLLGIKSAISFECTTNAFTLQNNTSTAIKTVGEIQIVHEELIQDDNKIETHQPAHNETEAENTRHLEILDVYSSEAAAQHKISYSIEHLAEPPNGSDYIITESSAGYTLTSNPKLEHVSSSDSDKMDDMEEVITEDSIDPEIGTDADIIEEFSNCTDPLLEMSANETDENVLVTNANNAAIPNNSSSTSSNTRIIHIKPSKIKAIKMKTNLSSHATQHLLNEHVDHIEQQTQSNAHAHEVDDVDDDDDDEDDDVVEDDVDEHAQQMQYAVNNKLDADGNLNDPISLKEEAHERSIDLAVQAVITEGISLQKAAHKFSISKTVLWRRVRKHPNYMKTTRENPVLKLAYERLKEGDTLKNISRDLEIPMSTLHRHKVRLAREGRLPKHVTFKKRGAMSKDELKAKLTKAVHACVHDGMSQNKSANLFDIPKSTLWRHLQKRVAEANLSKQDTLEIKEEIILS